MKDTKENSAKNKKRETIFRKIIKLLMFPLYLIKSLIDNITKRLRFSIAFKVSTSYLLLYFIILLFVVLTTSISFFITEILDFNNNVTSKDAAYVVSNLELSRIEFSKEEFSDTLTDLQIFNSERNNIYTLQSNDDILQNNEKYLYNTFFMIEKIIKDKIFVYNEEFNVDGSVFYINIFYDIVFIFNSTFEMAIISAVAGLIGLLFFMPLVRMVGRRLVLPIKKMTEFSKTISVNSINTRLNVVGAQDELKELSMTFNEMMDRIEEGYADQKRFVSDVSHELRTPIAVIKGYVNMLDRWGKNDKEVMEEAILAIKNETESMQDLIEKLLFIARNEKQNFTLNKEDFNICEILFEIEKETLMIDDKHKFEFRFLHDAPVYMDKNRVKQALRIFIDNAIKFTPHAGKISIYGYLEGDWYVIKIIDTGVGIAKKDLSKIFDRLYRTEESRNKKIGGHGLGLSIAKIIILNHRGKIKVKSTLGKGTEFTILLPHIFER